MKVATLNNFEVFRLTFANFTHLTAVNSQAPLQGSGDGPRNKKPSYGPDSTSRFVVG